MEKSFFEQKQEVEDILTEANRTYSVEEEIQTYHHTPNDSDRQRKARSIVYGYAKGQRKTSVDLKMDDVVLVWYCKTLQNWKALVAILGPDQLFFEVTHNGDKKETYLDVYQKTENIVFPDTYE